MEEDHDLPEDEGGSDYPKPPSVSAELWALIPENMRSDFIRRAAISLIKGIHPEDAIMELLDEQGISVKRPPVSKQTSAMILGRPQGMTRNVTPKTSSSLGFGSPFIKPKGLGLGKPFLKRFDTSNGSHQNTVMDTFDIADTF